MAEMQKQLGLSSSRAVAHQLDHVAFGVVEEHASRLHVRKVKDADRETSASCRCFSESKVAPSISHASDYQSGPHTRGVANSRT